MLYIPRDELSFVIKNCKIKLEWHHQKRFSPKMEASIVTQSLTLMKSMTQDFVDLFATKKDENKSLFQIENIKEEVEILLQIKTLSVENLHRIFDSAILEMSQKMDLQWISLIHIMAMDLNARKNWKTLQILCENVLDFLKNENLQDERDKFMIILNHCMKVQNNPKSELMRLSGRSQSVKTLNHLGMQNNPKSELLRLNGLSKSVKALNHLGKYQNFKGSKIPLFFSNSIGLSTPFWFFRVLLLSKFSTGCCTKTFLHLLEARKLR